MRPIVAATALLAMACAAHAQTLKPVLKTGLWEETVQVTINGRDLLEAMREARMAMIAQSPPDQRAQLEALLKQQGEPSNTSFECMTAKDVAEMAEPARALAKSMRDEPLCTAQVVSMAGNTFAYKSVCKDPEGFTGEFEGRYTVVDATRWSYTMTGRGKVAGDGMPGVAAKDGLVEMRNTGQARWVSDDCGKHKPQPR